MRHEFPSREAICLCVSVTSHTSEHWHLLTVYVLVSKPDVSWLSLLLLSYVCDQICTDHVLGHQLTNELIFEWGMEMGEILATDLAFYILD